MEEAEIAFREALSQARTMRHLARMLAASEALIELLLDRGDTAGAERLLADLWRYAPAELNRDYRANLLALRVALAAKDRTRAAAAYGRASEAAGERTIPEELETAHATADAPGRTTVKQ